MRSNISTSASGRVICLAILALVSNQVVGEATKKPALDKSQITDQEVSNELEQQVLEKKLSENGADSARVSSMGESDTSRQIRNSDFVIDSLDEKTSSGRLHYEPPSEQQTIDGKQQESSSNQYSDAQIAAPQTFKPEPRNHDDQQQQDPMVIDHRPTGSPMDQRVVYQVTEPAGPSVAVTTQPPAQSSNQGSSQSFTGPTMASTVPSQPTKWQSPSSLTFVQNQAAQQPYYQTGSVVHQTGGQQNPSTFGTVMSASNQVPSIQPHPNSINAIISDQQQQQVTGPTVIQQQTSSTPVGQIAQPVVSMLNGQPGSMVLLPNQGNVNGGRRISNWLRGISSMLANIFNRREHGALAPVGQSSNSIGHWIQLGPNAPHWLSQAQSAIHQQQQQFQQQFNANPLAIAASSNRYAFIPSSQQMMGQIQHQHPSSMTISMPQSAIISGQAQPQAQTLTNQGPSGELQSSASSVNYITAIQAPNQSQQQHQTTTTSATHNPQSSQSLNTIQGTSLAQQVLSGPTGPEQARQNSPNASQTNPPGTITAATQSWTNGVSQNNQHTQARFSRSSSLASSSQNLPLAHYSRMMGQAATDTLI